MYENERIDPMQIINDNLLNSKNQEAREKLGGALYALYCSFKNAYATERARMEHNEKLYHAKHWDEQKNKGNPLDPKPATPIIFSTIENIKADLAGKTPTGTIKPENTEDQDLARALTKICQQDLEASDWGNSSMDLYGDLLVIGWCVMEVGFDTDAMNGVGCAYIRRVAPFAFMCDPCSENLQDGRACFKSGTRTKEWFRQHYPNDYDKISYAPVKPEEYNPDSGVKPFNILNEEQEIIEAWVKIYDAEEKRASVHMIKLAGDYVLEVSTEIKREGYYMHGQYPFVLTALYPVNGTPFGYGIPDMHEASQMYSDKLDQIVLKNAFLASRNKLLVTDASGFDPDDLRDWSKDVHKGESLSGITWMQTAPLPSYILDYMTLMRANIKTESGANDQSRGQTGGGVTAASAIAALQQMATKRSAMHSQRFHAKFKQAYRMLLDVEREFAQSERKVVFMSHGSPKEMRVTPRDFSKIGDDGKPIEYHIVIETSDETQYSKIANNELALQVGTMFRDTIDPIAVLYMMDFPEKDLVIETIQDARNSQLIQMQAQIQELTELVQQLQKDNKNLIDGYSQAAGAAAQENYRQQASAEMDAEQQHAMAENMASA